MDAGAAARTTIAAHRGLHAAAGAAHENSIAALVDAAELGVDAVELDVRRMGDGTLVVHHDPRLGGQPLHRLDRSVLRAHPEVATLDDWARTAAKLNVDVLAEIKETGAARDAVRILRSHLPDERLAYMSFERDAVRAVRELVPEQPVGLLTYDLPLTRRVRSAIAPGSLARQAKRLGASFLGLNVTQTNDRVLQASNRAGMKVAVWTVNEADDMVRLLADPRVNTVITDLPQQTQQLRAAARGVADDAVTRGVQLLGRAVSLLR